MGGVVLDKLTNEITHPGAARLLFPDRIGRPRLAPIALRPVISIFEGAKPRQQQRSQKQEMLAGCVCQPQVQFPVQAGVGPVAGAVAAAAAARAAPNANLIE